MEINRNAIIDLLNNEALNVIPIEARSLLIGLFSDGLQGLMDAAVLNNIDKLPPFLRDIVSPYLLEIDWAAVPQQVSQLFNSFFREGGEGLGRVLDRLMGGIKIGNLSEFLSGLIPSFGSIQNVLSSIASGNFGGITQLLSDFGGIDLLSLIPGSGLIRTASTVFGVLFGEGDLFGRLFGSGGFGITTILGALGVGSTITGLIAPILGLFGIGGGASDPCPCDPKCRKTDHFVAEDGTELLREEKCATVISNSSSSYYSSGNTPDPSQTNNNLLSAAYGFIETGLGLGLIPQNVLNLTAAILEIPRLNKLGHQTESYQNADWPDFMNELAYSMKAIEHGFKVADNNITGTEKILRVLIDGQIFDDLFERKRDDKVMETLADTSMAVKEVYAMVLALDQAKMGGTVVPALPAKNVKKMIKSHAGLKKMRKTTWLEHLKKIKDFIELALSLWKALQPGASTSDLPSLVPGDSQNSPVSDAFPMEELRGGIDRFTSDYYGDIATLVHSENSQEIADIFEKISLKVDDSRDTLPSNPEYAEAYEETLNRLVRDRLEGTQPQGNQPRQDSTIQNQTPTSSDPRRRAITARDLGALAARSGQTDYNTLVKKLIDEQTAAERRKENC